MPIKVNTEKKNDYVQRTARNLFNEIVENANIGIATTELVVYQEGRREVKDELKRLLDEDLNRYRFLRFSSYHNGHRWVYPIEENLGNGNIMWKLKLMNNE